MRINKTKNRQRFTPTDKHSDRINPAPVYFMSHYSRDQNEDEDNEEVRIGFDYNDWQSNGTDKQNTRRRQLHS